MHTLYNLYTNCRRLSNIPQMSKNALNGDGIVQFFFSFLISDGILFSSPQLLKNAHHIYGIKKAGLAMLMQCPLVNQIEILSSIMIQYLGNLVSYFFRLCLVHRKFGGKHKKKKIKRKSKKKKKMKKNRKWI